jgi:hypothetical protein
MFVMKRFPLLSLVLLAAALPVLHASESKRTADYFLTTPTDFEGKEVTLDVSFVKPVHFKSPAPELAFFHAVTIDRVAQKPGGEILVAVPAEDAAKFAKKYGTNFEGRNDINSLRGTFLASPGHGPKGQAWFVDTSGKAADLIKEGKLVIEDQGPGHGEMQGQGPRRPGMN